jgi:FixJ family two-component response regulator
MERAKCAAYCEPSGRFESRSLAMSIIPGSVIVVDDDAAVRHALGFALEQEELEVRLYGSADELLADADLPARGCLLVDYQMPRMNGVELVERLRRSQVDLPAILITGRATDDLRRRALHSGFRQVLEKPLEDGALLDSIRGALTSSREQSRVQASGNS